MTLEHPPVARRKDIGAPDILTLETELERHQARNRAYVMSLMFVVLAAVEGLVIGFGFGVLWLGAVTAALAVAYIFVLLKVGGRLLVRALGAESARNPRIKRYVQHLATGASIPAPDALVVRGDRPNAFSIGLQPRAVIVTTGSLNLEDLTLEALIAHEVVHVRDDDALLSALFAAVAAPHALVRANPAAAVLIAPLSVLLAPAAFAVALLRSRWFESDHEHRADVAAALLTRYPPGVALALRLTQGASAPGPRSAARFWFAPASDKRAQLIEEM
jgi:Zn-dependent protease with chaperone function